MNRYEFYNRVQKLNESAENFVLAIKLLADNCNFREFKEEAVRDRLIIGLRDKDLRKKLLMDDDINLETVEKTIISCEKAESRADHMNDFDESNKVFSVKQRLSRRTHDFNHRGDSDRTRNRSWSRDRIRSYDRNRDFDRNRGYDRGSSQDHVWNRYYRNNRINKLTLALCVITVNVEVIFERIAISCRTIIVVKLLISLIKKRLWNQK